MNDRGKTTGGTGGMDGIWRDILEAMPGPVCVVDAGKRIRYVNPPMVALRGGTAGDEIVPGTPADEVLAPLPYEVQRSLYSVLRTGKVVTARISWIEREGGPLVLESTAFPVPGTGGGMPELAAWTAAVTPGELPAGEALAMEASRSKGKELLSVVRHDILNQLTILIGFLQFSEDFIEDSRVREFLAKEEAAGHVIQALIEFTRDFQDLAVEDPRWMRLDAVIRSAQGRVDTKGIEIVADAGTTEVYASPLIRHVFLTFIKNAVDHAHGLTRITLSQGVDGGDLVIACEDDGPGIPESERKTLFDRGHGRNRGYGLWLAKEILSITGAKIREAGKEGGGARFEIRVPAGMWREGDAS